MDGQIKHAWLRALGHRDLPEAVELSDGTYRLLRTYKHDFFAATGLYEGPSGKAILKLGRTVRFLGLPMAWLGRYLADHECRVYRAVEGLPGVPKCLGRYDRTGFVHAFVEGHPLQRYEHVDEHFFPRLRELLEALHARGIAYVDLEKRENILVGQDGRPYLIDFQISFMFPPRWRDRPSLAKLLPGPLGRFILGRLQAGDRYHLLKHHRRHRPQDLTPEQHAASYRRGIFIELHRRLFMPFTMIRRWILKQLTGRSRSPKQDGPEFVN